MDLHGDFHVYDTTLRDGAQQEGLNLSVADKLAIARQLDGLGVGYIEGGWPGANPKDTEFFRRARGRARPAQRQAGGVRRHPAGRASRRPTTRSSPPCATAAPSVVTLVAKSHDRHVELALRTTLEENLAMVRDTVSHLRAEGQTVFLDAEHFFDGYRANRDYALEVLRTAYDAGAEVIALCDTNGGMLPGWVADVVHDVARDTRRSGSASTATTTPAARSPTPSPPSTPARPTCRAPSTGTASAPATPTSSPSSPTSSSSWTGGCCRRACCADATRIAHAVAEVTNFPPASRQPYVGSSAFTHKAGPARQRDQGRPEPLPAHGPGRRRQRHEAAGLRHGRPRVDRAQGSRARLRPVRGPRAGHPGHRPGQGAGARRLHVRGGRRVVRAAARSRRSRARARRTSRSSRGA